MIEVKQIIHLHDNAHRVSEKLLVRPYSQDVVEDHIHDCFELAYVTGGSGIHVLNGSEQIEIKEGDYFIIDYGTVHRYADCKDMTVINCLFFPEVIHDTLSNCHSFDEVLKVCLMRYYKRYFTFTPANRVFHDEAGVVGAILKEMQSEYEQKLLGYEEMFRTGFMQILIHTMRKICYENGPDRYSEPVEKAVRYLNDHYREDAVIGNFCQQNHYNQQYISRRFRQETGVTAREYLQKIRIEKSCELLLDTNRQIQEIAALVGYDDIKFFQKTFQKMMHMTPRDYRKLMDQ